MLDRQTGESGSPSVRPSLDETLMAVAEVWARRSTCSRSRVGAVIARRGRTLASGHNGAPAGMKHCDHTCDCDQNWQQAWPTTHAPSCPAMRPCHNAVHAEANAIAFAARHGVALEGAELFTTLTPCLPCAQLIVNAGIRTVVAKTAYRDPAGVDLLRSVPGNLIRVEVWDE